ncbi:hypothetical protein CHLRE_13g572700v5 [Chlamydomonas reinhardtii]|uniref:Intraflagellar transport protein 144 n=1 Tax=Chlamydomonas reinhardtii TaxID=3055 RepID=A9XPA7_CHLRE|nr:uncharacterized protein CHLRE_13g572700v5 [Chlamydomonas reinhardtii]ABU95019.1 intraflagellar transport protein 144 [Chlamydomonas reinhardtii]PNW73788.1 hypothetical protein CHLRE_13g572700v5 [Chlamydomonas reinhardtii]8BDA_I Chain I, Intraflagellar transport protein 144 [Chlamydomonas reinhardtii]
MKKLFGVGPDLLGDGKVLFEWSPKGNFLAAAGSKRKVNIFDRNGRLYDEVHFPPAEYPNPDGRACAAAQMQWDPAGEQLAILPAGNTHVFIWLAGNKEVQKIESEFKTQEFSCMAWSRNGMYLGVATVKGNVMMYNARERKKTPLVGKHTKKIVAAAWNKDNIMALAGQDKTVTLTDGVTGDTIKTFHLKDVPMDLCVSDKKEDGYSRREENTYSLNINRKTLYIMQCTAEGDRPLELAFLDTYGPIMKHSWFGDGYILLGYKNGYVAVVSSHSREISEEVHSGKYLDTLTDVTYCASLGRVAMAGANCVRVLDANADYNEIKGDAVDLDANQAIEKVGWTKDGQVLTVGTHNGYMHSFLASLPMVYDFHGTRVLYLTSLLEMTLLDVSRRQTVARIELENEPAFCGLGPSHAAVGMNNQAAFYSLGEKVGKVVQRREYLGTITAIKLNETQAAVLTGGHVVVHPISVEAGHAPDELDVVIPGPGQPANITCVALTPTFVITGSRTGTLSYYLSPDVTPVNEFRHDDGGIVRLFPQATGARLVFEDDKGALHLFNPVNDHVVAVPYTGRAETVMWDTSDTNVMVIGDGTALHSFLYVPVSLTGPQVQDLGKQAVPATHTPLTVCNGVVGCRLKSGAMDNVTLESHKMLQPGDAVARAAPAKRFAAALKLYKLRDAVECAKQLRQVESWRTLALAALDVLDIDTAINAYREIGDASMVLSLERVRQHEDRNLLSAHIMVLLEKDYGQAQELFLRSSVPRAALEMRMDLKHWTDALKLAEQLDPDAIATICKEHGAMLEMTGEYSNAKSHYQQALDALAVSVGPAQPDLEAACKAGIARTTLQLGDLRQGRQLAMQLNSQTLFKECALILEGLQQLTEAAEMYERAGQFERAASIYIQTKNFAAAAPLMARISSSKLQLQFAKAKEAEGRWQEAAAAYEAAGDMDAVVRLCLERLSQPQRAYAIVRKTQSVEAANQLSRFCLQSQDFGGAVEFLLMAGQMDQAFDIAMGHNEMDTFARIVAASAKPVDYQRIAQYYESRGEYDKAADMWSKCDQAPRAVQLYLKVGTNPALEKAVQVVEQTRSHQLGVLVLDYVNEEKDGTTRDEFRFKLNIAMGQFAEAARDALEMARFEQEEGNYRVAHDKLFGTVKQLEALNTKPPGELLRALMLLHSYTLVKSLIAINDHTTAARMLVRVARNISKFPKHIVPILTSTVIECHRANLKKTAFEYASMLMRPEYRDQVAVKYKKKIELMVRKPEKDPEELEEPLADCPFCNMPGPETELQCISCQNILPFDLATGKRMVLSDWAECPGCKFPASASQFIRIISAEGRCPMCNDPVDLAHVRKVQDPLTKIKQQQAQQTNASGGGAS